MLTDDFIEHTHRDYGGGYFCTPDLFEALQKKEEEADRVRVALSECFKAMVLEGMHGAVGRISSELKIDI